MRLLTFILDAFRSQDRAVKQISDPVFGSMRLNAVGICRGKIAFPAVGSEVSLNIYDPSDNGPTEWHRQLFLELIRRYPELRKAIEVPLWTEYEKIRRQWGLKSPPVVRPEEIWSIAHLFAIEIYGKESKSGVDFSLDHQIDWETDDHDLNVTIKGWQVIEVKMEG